MMPINDAIKRLIRGGESQEVEFKTKANHPEKIVKEVVAFANAGGGHLFVGVLDNGQIQGLKYPDDEAFVLTKAIHELCKPKVHFTVDHCYTPDGKEFLHYYIEEGKRKPFYALLEKSHRFGKAYIRVEDRSIQASYEMRKVLKFSSRSSPPIEYEEQTRKLFNYFTDNPHITLNKYAEISGLNKRLASNKLVSLALSGALKIIPREGEDLYFPT